MTNHDNRLENAEVWLVYPDVVVRGLAECERAELLDVYFGVLAELRERNSGENDGGPPADPEVSP